MLFRSVAAEPVVLPEATVEPEVIEEVPAAKPARARRTKAAKAEAISDPAAVEPVPVTTPEPEPVMEAPKPREPDPAEISAPPATPRKGWWRR